MILLFVSKTLAKLRFEARSKGTQGLSRRTFPLSRLQRVGDIKKESAALYPITEVDETEGYPRFPDVMFKDLSKLIEANGKGDYLSLRDAI